MFLVQRSVDEYIESDRAKHFLCGRHFSRWQFKVCSEFNVQSSTGKVMRTVYAVHESFGMKRISRWLNNVQSRQMNIYWKWYFSKEFVSRSHFLFCVFSARLRLSLVSAITDSKWHRKHGKCVHQREEEKVPRMSSKHGFVFGMPYFFRSRRHSSNEIDILPHQRITRSTSQPNNRFLILQPCSAKLLPLLKLDFHCL